MTVAILSYAVWNLYKGTGELRKTCSDTAGHLIASGGPSVAKIWPHAQRGHGPPDTHPSTHLAQNCLIWVMLGIGHLPHNERCRFGKVIIVI